ncbi:hypothetical protein ncot_18770 [Nocardioides sp. JQ2195]|uniref:hypothetical protein n=1 Tax=Nocardioides sp. JQ2195 TaxID=2592334 RepID=UPI00143EA70C|nr:hypothetical protein [Nocardioides sp. JQ2195]QIX28407.1 hypothetical protein ncot_18770 [Nocardioides sp. JQ2195]
MQTGHTGAVLDIDEAVNLTRTGDLWLFRGRTATDRAIRTLTNAPVNHVGVAIVIDDLPPLMWHAELSKKLLDQWSGGHHRGVQLHDLKQALTQWRDVYGQASWLRQLAPEVGRAEENAALRTVARLDGVSFPSTAKLASRWLRGRDAYVPRRKRGHRVRPEAAFCAEVVAETLMEMGILLDDRKATWFDPGTFWSGAYLPVAEPWSYGGEVQVGPEPEGAAPSSRTRWR